jgi:hypothetical protein
MITRKPVNNIVMPIINKLKEIVLSHIATIYVTLITALLVMVANQIFPLILPVLLEKLPNKTTLTLLALSILINMVFLSFFFYYKFSNKLKLKFGVLWDRNKVILSGKA